MIYVDDVAQLDASTLAALRDLAAAPIAIQTLVISRKAGQVPGVQVLVDAQGHFAKRYDAKAGSTWLARPDQHICARWRHFNAAAVQAALQHAVCKA